MTAPTARTGSDAPSLRCYQSKLQSDAAALLSEAKRGRVLMQAETGAGKTITAVAAARFMLDERASAEYLSPELVIGWLTDRDELRRQSADAMDLFDVKCVHAKFAPARARTWQPGAVTVFSPAMRMPSPPSRSRDEDGEPVEPDLEAPVKSVLFVDEAHHSLAPTWRRVIEAGWDVVIGLTATPWLLKPSADLRTVWDKLAAGPVYAALVKLGALADFVIDYPEHGAVIRRKVLKRDSSGEYTNESVTGEVTRLMSTESVHDEWVRATKNEGVTDKRTILFAPTVDSAKQAAEQFAAEGVPSAVLHAATPQTERREIVEAFKRGEITVLSNVAIATEGFDCPAAAVVVLLRPTASLGLHRQMIGRALRPSEGKRRALVLDLVGNCLEHGGPDRAIPWSLEPRGTKKGRGGFVALPCPYDDCNSVNAASAGHCKACAQPLRFSCGQCFRKLLWKRFVHSIRYDDLPQPNGKIRLAPIITEADRSVHAVSDRDPCWECTKALESVAVAIERCVNGGLSPHLWKATRKTYGVRIRTSRKLPDHPDSDGTRFAFGGSLTYRDELVMCPIYKSEEQNRYHRPRWERPPNRTTHIGYCGSRLDASIRAAEELVGQELRRPLRSAGEQLWQFSSKR